MLILGVIRLLGWDNYYKVNDKKVEGSISNPNKNTN